jgi:hypothetical protein
VEGIARLENPRFRDVRHTLSIIRSGGEPPFDRRSLQHLVDFLDNADSNEAALTELHFHGTDLVSDPSPDAGLNVLKAFFGRNDTTVTKVKFWECSFSSRDDASHLLTAFHTNRIVTDLTIRRFRNIDRDGAAFGTCLSNLMQNMPQLQRLKCDGSVE